MENKEINKIIIKNGEYTILTTEESKIFFEFDANKLEEINNGKVGVIFYTDENADIVQSATMEAGGNPGNIDVWGVDDWVDCEGILKVEGDL